MPAAVGIRATGAGNVTAAGTFTATPRPPVMAGSTVIEAFQDGDLNAAANLQATLARNPYQEVNLLIGELARNWALSPVAAAQRLVTIVRSMYAQFPS